MPNITWKRCFNPKVLIGLGVIAVLAFSIFPEKEKITALLPFLLILACPLSMMFMMKGMGKDKECETQPFQERSSPTVLSTCPECGLSYRERAWAEKCEAWCRAHKTCNLEITQHAVKPKG